MRKENRRIANPSEGSTTFGDERHVGEGGGYRFASYRFARFAIDFLPARISIVESDWLLFLSVIFCFVLKMRNRGIRFVRSISATRHWSIGQADRGGRSSFVSSRISSLIRRFRFFLSPFKKKNITLMVDSILRRRRLGFAAVRLAFWTFAVSWLVPTAPGCCARNLFFFSVPFLSLSPSFCLHPPFYFEICLICSFHWTSSSSSSSSSSSFGDRLAVLDDCRLLIGRRGRAESIETDSRLGIPFRDGLVLVRRHLSTSSMSWIRKAISEMVGFFICVIFDWIIFQVAQILSLSNPPLLCCCCCCCWCCCCCCCSPK